MKFEGLQLLSGLLLLAINVSSTTVAENATVRAPSQ